MVASRLESYKQGASSLRDEFGWYYAPECDALGFDAMTHWGYDKAFKFHSAYNGKIYLRRPKAYGDCYPVDSGSQNSRDHVLRLGWYLYMTGETQVLGQLVDSIRDMGYVYGEGPLSRTLITPSLFDTLERAAGRAPSNPVGYLPTGDDYTAELAATHILFRYQLTGDLWDTHLAFLDDRIKRHGENPLFRVVRWYLTGQGAEEAVSALLGPEWPATRLPGSEDHCESWITQRNPGADWEPCEGNERHPAGEWAWLARLMKEGR